MDSDLGGALILLLLAAGVFVLALAAWPVALIGLILSFKRGGRWLAWRRRFIVILVISTVVLLVAVANAVWSAWTAPPNDEDAAKIAAVAEVRSQFADPKAVRVQKLWIGKQDRFGRPICGVVDSDELVDPSEFIFGTDFSAPPLQFDKPQEGRRGDFVMLRFPPSIEGAGKKDATYWERVMNESSLFDARWAERCAASEPPAVQGEKH